MIITTLPNYKKGELILFNPHAFKCKAPNIPTGQHYVTAIREVKHKYGSTGWHIKTNKCQSWIDQGWFMKNTKDSELLLLPEEDRRFILMAEHAEKVLPDIKLQYSAKHAINQLYC